MTEITREQWLQSMEASILTLNALSTSMQGGTDSAERALEEIKSQLVVIELTIQAAKIIQKNVNTLMEQTEGLRDILAQST